MDQFAIKIDMSASVSLEPVYSYTVGTLLYEGEPLDVSKYGSPANFLNMPTTFSSDWNWLQSYPWTAPTELPDEMFRTSLAFYADTNFTNGSILYDLEIVDVIEYDGTQPLDLPVESFEYNYYTYNSYDVQWSEAQTGTVTFPDYFWYILDVPSLEAKDDSIAVMLFEFGDLIGNVLENDIYDEPGTLRVVEREFSQDGFNFSISENGDVVIVSGENDAQVPERTPFQYTVVAPDGQYDVGQVNILAPPCNDIDRFTKLTNSLSENIEKLELSKSVIASNQFQIEQLGSATAGLGITLSWSAGAYTAARWAELTVEYLTSVAGAFNPIYGAYFDAAKALRDLARGDIGKINVDGIKLTFETMVDGAVQNDELFKELPGKLGTGLGLLYDTLKLPYDVQTVQDETKQARDDIQTVAVYLDELQQEIDARIVANQALLQTISQQELLLKQMDCRHEPVAEFLQDVSSVVTSSVLPSAVLPVNPLEIAFYDINTSKEFQEIAEAGAKNPDIQVELGSEQNDNFDATESDEVFVTSQGDDNVSGTAQQLNGDQIIGFKNGDTITIVGPSVDGSSFELKDGSTIIDIDVDDDQVSDVTITLLGDAPKTLNVTQSNGNTIISADGIGEVISVEGTPDDDDEDPSTGEFIEGTDDSDNLTGTEGDDEIRGYAGRYDKMFGDIGADQFIFGAEANNGARERNVILDYEVGIDEILLEDGASIASIRQTSSQVVVFLEGDRDAIYVRGDGVTADNITIVTDDVFELV